MFFLEVRNSRKKSLASFSTSSSCLPSTHTQMARGIDKGCNTFDFMAINMGEIYTVLQHIHFCVDYFATHNCVVGDF